MVTVMSPEGKPIQVNASALQAAGAQNTIGTLTFWKFDYTYEFSRIVNMLTKSLMISAQF